MPEVDRLWADCLAGTGPLAAWLAEDRPPETWSEPVPLHSVLASHPFPDLILWSIQATSSGS